MQPDVVLLVNGKEYSGWQSVRVGRSIESISGFFEITFTERWGDQVTRWPIKPGDACELLIANQLVITGYVDDIDIQYDVAEHSLVVRGRDKTGDLVDSSAEHSNGQFNDQDLKQIATKLCAPLSIDVLCECDVGDAFKQQSINQGETIFELLERLARHRAVLLLSESGNLRITRPGTEVVPVALELGKNILACGASFSHRERFNRYIVKSSTAGDDFTFGEAAASPSGLATDESIRPTRKRIDIAEEPSSAKACQDRAIWQRNVNAGRSTRINYTVNGWRYDDANIWPVNSMLQVKDNFLNLDHELLIVSVGFSLDDRGGEITELTLMPRESFELTEIPETESDELVWSTPS